MTKQHHTPEQVDLAFSYAPIILRELKDAGVPYPAFELYEDGSGRLRLGNEGEGITGDQQDLAERLLNSVRSYQMFCNQCYEGNDKHPHPIGVTFCCGLVTAAEDAIKRQNQKSKCDHDMVRTGSGTYCLKPDCDVNWT